MSTQSTRSDSKRKRIASTLRVLCGAYAALADENTDASANPRHLCSNKVASESRVAETIPEKVNQMVAVQIQTVVEIRTLQTNGVYINSLVWQFGELVLVNPRLSATINYIRNYKHYKYQKESKKDLPKELGKTLIAEISVKP